MIAGVFVALLLPLGCDPGLDSAGVTTSEQSALLRNGEVAAGVVKVTASPATSGVANRILVKATTLGDETRIRIETWPARLQGPQETVTSQTIMQAPRQEFEITPQQSNAGDTFVGTSDKPPCDGCEFEFRYRITNVQGAAVNIQYSAVVSHALFHDEAPSAQISATIVPD